MTCKPRNSSSIDLFIDTQLGYTLPAHGGVTLLALYVLTVLIFTHSESRNAY